MKFNKFALFLLVGIWCLYGTLANPTGTPKPTLKGVTISSHPYVEPDAGSSKKFKGFAVDLIDKVAEKAGFNYELHLVADGFYGKVSKEGTWDGMIAEVIQDKADFALPDLSITEARAAVVDFSTPFLNDTISLLIDKKHAQTLTTIEDFIRENEQLKAKSGETPIPVGVIQSGSTLAALESNDKPLGISLREMVKSDPANLQSSNNEGVKKVGESRFGMLMSNLVAEYKAGSNCNLKVLKDGGALNLNDIGYGIALKKGSTWLEPINRAIKELVQDGTVEKLKKQHWPSQCA